MHQAGGMEAKGCHLHTGLQGAGRGGGLAACDQGWASSLRGGFSLGMAVRATRAAGEPHPTYPRPSFRGHRAWLQLWFACPEAIPPSMHGGAWSGRVMAVAAVWAGEVVAWHVPAPSCHRPQALQRAAGLGRHRRHHRLQPVEVGRGKARLEQVHCFGKSSIPL